MSSKSNTLIHLTHNDGDAVGCDLLLHYTYPDCDKKTYWSTPNDADSVMSGLIENWEENDLYPKYVIISDISVSKETFQKLRLLKIRNKIQDVHMFDHHQTNPCAMYYGDTTIQNEIDGIPASAAMLILKYEPFVKMFTNRGHNHNKYRVIHSILYSIVRSISRYDTWEWKNHPEPTEIPESIIADICKFIGPDATVEKLIIHIDKLAVSSDTIITDKNIYPDLFIELNDIFTIKKTNAIKDIENFVSVTREGEYIYATFVADNGYTNEIAEAVYINYDIDIVRILYPSKLTVGFRTRKSDINVGRLASRLYNGGGHQKASGAKISIEEMFKMYTATLNAPTLHEYFYK